MSDPRILQLREHIRDVPDFPKPGILFKDITPLLADGAAFRDVTTLLAERIAPFSPDRVVGIESRGFLFGAALADRLGVGISPVRKPGKLPWRAARETYALEMHSDALHPGARAVIVDDLLATGGTAAATARLCAAQGAFVIGCCFVVELEFLRGRERLAPMPVESLLVY